MYSFFDVPGHWNTGEVSRTDTGLTPQSSHGSGGQQDRPQAKRLNKNAVCQAVWLKCSHHIYARTSQTGCSAEGGFTTGAPHRREWCPGVSVLTTSCHCQYPAVLLIISVFGKVFQFLRTGAVCEVGRNGGMA